MSSVFIFQSVWVKVWNFIDFSQVVSFWFHWFFSLFYFLFLLFYSDIYYLFFLHSLDFSCSLFPVSLGRSRIPWFETSFFSDIDVSCYKFPCFFDTHTFFDMLVFIFILVKVPCNFLFCCLSLTYGLFTLLSIKFPGVRSLL